MSINRDYFWFRLFKTRGIGPKLLVSIAEILEADNLNPEILPRSQSELSAQFPKLAKILNGKIRAEDREKVSKEYEELKRQGVNIIYPGHPDLQPHILEISPILFVKGRQKRLMSDSVAIVGARNVSDIGIRIAKKLAGDLADEGLNIVSGYAKGVDSEAHLGALEAEGTTTLVLPHGIKQLHQKSAFKKFNWDQDVLAVSQFDPNSRWRARNAMVRNKLVCGLSKAVVVIESGPERNEQGKMSGTFSAAKTALSMDLPLFVLNPNCLDDAPKGNAELIKLGGYSLDPVNGAKEIVERIFVKKAKPASIANQNSTEQLSLF
ncbi:MAG: DNA-processing protein DprA [Candidatus Poribacteria bacterium]|nr:DNA-processing protein DprA [Candidatus Poribacteria bacterium]